MNTPTLADRLRALRAWSGLTAIELSVLAGLDRSHVRLLEAGLRKTPAAETVVSLGQVLGTTTEWLTRGGGRAPTERTVRAAVKTARAAKGGV
jgi:transcriptional regulator with XRE-family HTH domain